MLEWGGLLYNLEYIPTIQIKNFTILGMSADDEDLTLYWKVSKQIVGREATDISLQEV